MRISRRRLLRVGVPALAVAIAASLVVVIIAPWNHDPQPGGGLANSGHASTQAPRPATTPGETSVPSSSHSPQGSRRGNRTSGSRGTTGQSPGGTGSSSPSSSAPGKGSPSPSDSSGPAASPSASTSSSPVPSPTPHPRVPTQAELEAALLTASEVGPGFQVQSPGSGVSEDSLNNACPAVEAGINPSETAIRAFEANPGSTSVDDVTEELLQYPVSGAEASLDQFAQVVNACGSLSLTTPTSIGTLHLQIGLANEAFPAVGDQTAAIRVTVNVLTFGVTVTGDIVAVRHGGTVVLVVNVALEVNSDLTRSVVDTAFAKVAARW
jgi:hypothetical protein